MCRTRLGSPLVGKLGGVGVAVELAAGKTTALRHPGNHRKHKILVSEGLVEETRTQKSKATPLRSANRGWLKGKVTLSLQTAAISLGE